ncbi:MAG: class II aldolase/adducin family protein [Candidatus Woesearchaeota archaeon]|jgi:ribulose-5-phosphate 4-epimerase/fuculose-1-phosphate aldolase|nr:class II aldolase/adducin family protein [Candidatus Woesearchaeota archaeon]MDP7457144.1 class II aldolase/adducin family protein [Candidatus Woesearchaeota archaeon]|tara:strand:- start:74 stop:817 length:744 start_codon:yes stop_codon:yes gene_type:complete
MVQKYEKRHTQTEPFPYSLVEELLYLRDVHHKMGWIGYKPFRYTEIFGNVSQWIDEGVFGKKPGLLITGTGTGVKERIWGGDFAMVPDVDEDNFVITSYGPSGPSAEAGTHMKVSELMGRPKFICHPHAIMWRLHKFFSYLTTVEGVDYGTKEMVQEFDRLLPLHQAKSDRLVIMGGHLDGIVSWGDTVEDAMKPLLKYEALCKQKIVEICSDPKRRNDRLIEVSDLVTMEDLYNAFIGQDTEPVRN